jgi:arabinogalactan endo-1,4-beta-galactosidase
MKLKTIIATALSVLLIGMPLSSVDKQGANAVDATVYFSEFDATVNDGEPIRGVDLSSILSVESAGVVFYDEDGNEQDIFKTLAENKVNYVRVRVWNDPYDSDGNSYGGGNCDVATAAEIGRRAAQYNMKLLVDFQYSDFWADPAKQTVPKAWSSYTYEQKKQAIYDYTLESLQTIADAGANIGMVQVGNETNNFFCGESDMYQISELFSSGCAAVRNFDSSILIALHFADPSTGFYDWYAQVLDECNVDYDVFATSYYSYWQGTTENLTSVLKNIADTYNKYVMVAETAYPYTDDDGDSYGNEVLSTAENVNFYYDISVEGQAQCLTDVFQAVANVGSKGIGVFYWEPAWIGVENLSWDEQNTLWGAYGCGWATAYAGEYDSSAIATGGSSYDNQALFDFSGKPLDSLKVFSNIYPQAVSDLNSEPETEPYEPETEPETEPVPEPDPYEVADIADGTYTIRNVNSNLFLAENNGNAIQSAEQVWVLTNLGDGIYIIQTKDGKTLTVEDSSAENGANISLQDFYGDDAQKFILRANDDGTFALLTMTSSGTHCADVFGISFDDGANICQWEYWGGDGQKFIIEPFTEATEPEKLIGDANLDGAVTISDAVVLQKYLLGSGALTEEQWNAADIIDKGTVNVLDMVALKRILVQSIS